MLLRLLITAEISLYALGVLNFEQFIVGYIAIYFVPMLILLLYTLYLRESHLHPVITSRTKKLVTTQASTVCGSTSAARRCS